MFDSPAATRHSPPATPLAGLRIAMLSVHTCPLAMLGGKKTGGMNVYVLSLIHISEPTRPY